VLGVSNEVGIFLNEKLQAEETNQSYFVVAKNEFCYNPYRINVGSIGLNTNDYDNQIISGAYIVFACNEDELNPKYLDTLFKSKGFLNYVNDKANGGVRMNFKFEDMEAWEIPLPSLDEQNAIVAQIEKQKAIIEGVEKIVINTGNSFSDGNYTRKPIGDFAKVLGGFSFPSTEVSEIKYENHIPLIKIGSVLNGKITDDLGYVNENYKTSKPNFVLRKGDIVFAMTRPIIKSGLKYAIIDDNFDGSMLNQRVGKWQFYSNDLLPAYLAFFMGTDFYLRQLESFCSDEANQPNVSNGEFESILIPLPSIDEQEQLIKVIEEHNKLLEGLHKMKSEAQQKINQILADVWGVEFVEPEKELVEDEQEN